MLIIVVYDIDFTDEGGPKRLQKVSKLCEKYGQRAQNSVFECKIQWDKFLEFKKELTKTIDVSKDSVTIYNLGNKWQNKVEKIGIEKSLNPDSPIII